VLTRMFSGQVGDQPRSSIEKVVDSTPRVAEVEKSSPKR